LDQYYVGFMLFKRIFDFSYISRKREKEERRVEREAGERKR
jgi:hypothetical protein